MVFDYFNLEGVKFPNDDPLVITTIIGNSPVKRVLVDNGASVDIVLYDTFIRMGYNDSQLTPTDMSIYGFAGVECPVEGIIKLPLTMGSGAKTSHADVKLCGSKGWEKKGETRRWLEVVISLAKGRWSRGQVLPIEDLDIRENDKKLGKPAEDLILVSLAPKDPEKVSFIGASSEEPLKGKLVSFLQGNNDVFAWSAADMPDIDPKLITHKLNVDPNRKTVKKKKRRFSPERKEAIKQEMEKLLEAGFIE
ncbi:uncharacterized protein LOC141674079 [Apium graveolens]|uniref:uncharacterized protein LOC141674079 n=1 Tax=Apium graveolens TaxID=4045 RepID=UPI003D7A3A42